MSMLKNLMEGMRGQEPSKMDYIRLDNLSYVMETDDPRYPDDPMQGADWALAWQSFQFLNMQINDSQGPLYSWQEVIESEDGSTWIPSGSGRLGILNAQEVNFTQNIPVGTVCLGWATAGNAGNNWRFIAPTPLGGVNLQPQAGLTTYTLQADDEGNLVTFSSGSSMTLTLPQPGVDPEEPTDPEPGDVGYFQYGWLCDIENMGVGLLTLTPVSSLIDNTSSLVIGPNQGIRLFSNGTNWYTQRGMGVGNNITVQDITFLSGGEILLPSGTVSVLPQPSTQGGWYYGVPINLCGWMFWCQKLVTLPSTSVAQDLQLSGGYPGEIVYLLGGIAFPIAIGGIVQNNPLFPTAGQVIGLINVTTYPITLNDEDTGSANNNRFKLPNGQDYIIYPDAGVLLYHDQVGNRWHIFEDGQVTNNSGTSYLINDYVVTGLFANIGVSITFPNAGEYLVFYTVQAIMTTTAGVGGTNQILVMPDIGGARVIAASFSLVDPSATSVTVSNTNSTTFIFSATAGQVMNLTASSVGAPTSAVVSGSKSTFIGFIQIS